MTHLKTTALCLLFPGLFACGGQLVEFKDTGSDSDADTDTDSDTDTDTDGDTDTDTDTDTDDQPPFVVTTNPDSDATGVAITASIFATFSEAMEPSTISTLAFVLQQDTTPVAGGVTLDESTNTAAFDPAAPLVPGLLYTATITVRAEDLAGNALVDNYTWMFTTDPVAPIPPTVDFVTPLDGEVDVSTAEEPTATFSTEMDPASITSLTFLVEHGSVPVPGVVTLDEGTNTAMFTPDDALDNDAVYTATITTGATDLDGLALEDDYSWSFTTSAQPPMVILTTPTDLATDVSINTRPTATFDTAMDPTSLTTLSFVVEQGSSPVSGVVTLDETTNTATFTPDGALELGLAYTATITTDATDLAGTPLEDPYTWTFTTGACSLAPIDLGSASAFAVLGGSTVTSTGATLVTGDLGVSPGTAVTGFPPGVIVGSTFAGDPTAATGIADLTIAYNAAAALTLCPVSVAGNIGGTTLTPGLYTSTSSLEISSGDLTLDAQGDVDAVFVFQMASTLTTTSGRQVILTNGAKATNVFWQVGTSATIGTTSAFVGTIMADQAVTLETGALLDGRALARIAAVSLDTNVIVTPSP